MRPTILTMLLIGLLACITPSNAYHPTAQQSPTNHIHANNVAYQPHHASNLHYSSYNPTDSSVDTAADTVSNLPHTNHNPQDSTSHPTNDAMNSNFKDAHSTASNSFNDDNFTNNASTSTLTTTSPSTTRGYRSQYRYTCPPDFLRLGNGCYYFSKDMAGWREAHFRCKARNSSKLAALDSEWEDRLIRTHLNRTPMTRLNRWLGGIYDWAQHEWVWGGSGEVMRYTGFLVDSHSGRWKCVYVAPNLYYRWNYKKCTTVMHYICETPFVRVLRLI